MVVTPQNPLKNPNIYKPFKQRFQLAQELTDQYRFIEVSDIDQKLNNYKTINTVRYFNKKFTNDDLFLDNGSR